MLFSSCADFCRVGKGKKCDIGSSDVWSMALNCKASSSPSKSKGDSFLDRQIKKHYWSTAFGWQAFLHPPIIRTLPPLNQRPPLHPTAGRLRDLSSCMIPTSFSITANLRRPPSSDLFLPRSPLGVLDWRYSTTLPGDKKNLNQWLTRTRRPHLKPIILSHSAVAGRLC